MNTFDAMCARCGHGESEHCPDIVGENRTEAMMCPALAQQAQPEMPSDVREALEWIRDRGAGDTVGVYDRARFLARRLL